MNKQQLRSIYLEKRVQLSDSEFVERTQKIADLFFENFDLKPRKVVHTFLPITENKEPDTWLMINRIKKEYPSIRISIPKVNNATQLLDNFYFESHDQLKENAWGIPEPQYGELTTPGDIDLVLVPMLVVDAKGHRVGYGKGYYDKFLARCQPTCLKIGVSLFEHVEEIKDVNELDVALDFCITPDTILEF